MVVEKETGVAFVDTTLLGSQHTAGEIYNLGVLYELFVLRSRTITSFGKAETSYMGFIIVVGSLVEVFESRRKSPI